MFDVIQFSGSAEEVHAQLKDLNQALEGKAAVNIICLTDGNKNFITVVTKENYKAPVAEKKD